jgi:hypothetical protein
VLGLWASSTACRSVVIDRSREDEHSWLYSWIAATLMARDVL